MAAILSLIGAAWYGFIVVRDWEAMTYAFESFGQLSGLGLETSATAWFYAAVAAMIAQGISVPLLLFGGILLLTRTPAGRVMVILGSCLVLAINAFGAIAAFQAIGWANSLVTEFGGAEPFGGEMIAMVLLFSGLPILLAVVTLVLAMSGSAKRWCQRTIGYAAPTY